MSNTLSFEVDVLVDTILFEGLHYQWKNIQISEIKEQTVHDESFLMIAKFSYEKDGQSFQELCVCPFTHSESGLVFQQNGVSFIDAKTDNLMA